MPCVQHLWVYTLAHNIECIYSDAAVCPELDEGNLFK